MDKSTKEQIISTLKDNPENISQVLELINEQEKREIELRKLGMILGASIVFVCIGGAIYLLAIGVGGFVAPLALIIAALCGMGGILALASMQSVSIKEFGDLISKAKKIQVADARKVNIPLPELKEKEKELIEVRRDEDYI